MPKLQIWKYTDQYILSFRSYGINCEVDIHVNVQISSAEPSVEIVSDHPGVGDRKRTLMASMKEATPAANTRSNLGNDAPKNGSTVGNREIEKKKQLRKEGLKGKNNMHNFQHVNRAVFVDRQNKRKRRNSDPTPHGLFTL